MEIQILGAHNLETPESKLVSLLIDGILALDAGSLTSSLSLADQARLKAILLTHCHFDHLRDIPAIALATAYLGTTHVYAMATTLNALSSHLINGEIYPKFEEWPSAERPSLKLHVLEPFKPESVVGYKVVALPVKHAGAAVGFEITSVEGKSLFYSGDSGAGLSTCWPHLSPQLMIIEVTGPNRWEKMMREAGHLTPELLRQELREFQRLKGYLPPVVAVHLNPQVRDEIVGEIAELAEEFGSPISVGQEGMKISL